MVNKPKLPILNRAHPLARGLVSAVLMYEGNGVSAKDATGYQSHGAITGAAWLRTARGWALDFTASSGTYMTIVDSTLPTLTNAFSFFVMFYIDAARNFNGIIQKGASGVPGPIDFWVGASNNGQFNYGNGAYRFDHKATIASGAWHTLASTKTTGNLVTSYLNGASFGSTTSALVADTANNLLVGKRAGDGTLLDGKASVVLVANRAWTAAEVRALHADPYQAFRPRIPYGPLLTAAAVASTIRLTWTDNTGGMTFNIERSIVSAYTGFTEIIAGETSPYDDAGLADDTYWYRIRGYDGTNYTDYSNVIEITVTS